MAGQRVVYMGSCDELVHVHMVLDPSNHVPVPLSFIRSFCERYLIGGCNPGVVQVPVSVVPRSAKELDDRLQGHSAMTTPSGDLSFVLRLAHWWVQLRGTN